MIREGDFIFCIKSFTIEGGLCDNVYPIGKYKVLFAGRGLAIKNNEGKYFYLDNIGWNFDEYFERV